MESLKQTITELGKTPIDVTKLVNTPEDLKKLSDTILNVRSLDKVYIIGNSELVFKMISAIYRISSKMTLDPESNKDCFMFFHDEGFYHGNLGDISKLSIRKYFEGSKEDECNICYEVPTNCVGFFSCPKCTFSMCHKCLNKNGKKCPICREDFNVIN